MKRRSRGFISGWLCGWRKERKPIRETPTRTLSLTDGEKEILRRRIPEAAAWATRTSQGTLTKGSSRTRELMPEGYADDLWLCDQPPDLLGRWIEHVSSERAKATAERNLRLPSLASALESGFILAHDVSVCTREEMAAAESPFFDRNDNSAWDAWLLLVDPEGGPIWLSWIDGSHADEADAAANLTMMDCLFWVDTEGLRLL